MIKIAHIINPFKPLKNSDLQYAQHITFESIRRAKGQVQDNINIQVLCACYQEDKDIIPSDFEKLPHLTESVLDFQQFKHPRKLPIIREILEKAFQYSNADYFIYTNIDISLYPNFYTQIIEHLENGHDALIINRRRIPVIHTRVEDIEKIYLQTGKSHPGFDCFVFHKSLIPQFFLSNICVGVPFFEISFSQNLFCYAQSLLWIQDGNQTFHIGMEIFKKRQPRTYFKYNKYEWRKVESKLYKDMSLKKIPYAEQCIIQRFIKWGFHPCFPIRLMIRLQWKQWFCPK
ncbi:MAG: hypothetical protein IAE67_05075 [Candidatus Competibacteraceae bacterium]|nr:hypothetical protein [Candidatus Competibacteraceae bacterium]